MSHQTESSHFRRLFDAAMRDYEETTNVTLVKHPLAEKIQNCHSVEPIITLLQDQAREFGDFLGSDRIQRTIKNIVSALWMFGTTAVVGDALNLSLAPASAILTGCAILLVAAKGVNTSYNALIDLLESIEHLLRPLDIYTQIPHTPAMDEMVFKIFMELLSTLALMTKELQRGGPKKFGRKIVREKDAEAILRRLDRLSNDEARTTTAEILKVIYGLFQDMNGTAHCDNVRESLKIIHQIASDLNKSKRDQSQKAIRRWLSPPDPWKNHHLAHESRHEATATWFVQGGTFSEWKSSGRSSLLWIHGKPGAGKSVFCSTIIEEIEAMRKSGLASLAFFYHDFREDQKKDRRGLLSSLLVQLCHQSDPYCDIITGFYLEHGSGSQHPSDSALIRCLMDVLRLPGQAQVYLIVDALDECPNTSSMPSPREQVLKFVEALIDTRLPNLRICVTSRPEIDIKNHLEPLSFRSISLHDESGQMEDIENYIKSVITKDPRNRRWKAEDKQLVIDTLIKYADGMFRWVYCQVVYLRGCHPGRIRHALYQLPETLDETYERILREINKADWELAHQLFQCVAVTSRPLRVDELAEFLAFDFNAGPIAKFEEGWRLEDPVDAVFSTCSTLLTLVNVDGSSIIQFSHFSVKEFLTSTRLAEAPAEILRRYHIFTISAQTLVAQACLGILLHLDKTISRGDLKKYPLVEYAGRHWVEHARFEDISQYTEDGMKQLFDPRKPHLGIWIWIWDPRNLSMDSERSERPSPPGGTPLHYAAVCGLHGIAKFLAIEYPRDVDLPRFEDKWTPLHVASSYGHVDVGRVLVEQGANVTTRDTRGNTPLHLASVNGRLDVACFLVEHGADMTARDKDGQCSLFWASIKGHTEVAHYLIEQGADVTAQDNGGGTILHASAYGPGSVEVARFLVEHGADATTRDKGGKTPLHMASQEGNVEVARFLVENGADVTTRANDGWTPLHLASSFGFIEVVRILIKHDAVVTTQSNNGQSPLHVASSYGNLIIARILVEHGADVVARADNGWTPLHSASSCGGVEIVRFLVEHGADAIVKDNHGLTPWDVASRKGHVGVAHFLAEHSAYAAPQTSQTTPVLTVQDNDTWTPLHVAAEEGNLDLVRILVGQGADLTVQASGGWTPLHLASSCGNVEVVQILCEHGADATAQADNGWTPLHVASSCGSMEVARFLVEHGADTTAQADDGRTPSDEALSSGHDEVARFLYEHNTDTTTGRPTRGNHYFYFYYFFTFCFLVEIYLRFL